jgi:hypothetical protein
MNRFYVGFVAPQISTADLDAGSAKRERGGDATRIRDATGGDYRNPGRVDDLGNKRKRVIWWLTAEAETPSSSAASLTRPVSTTA